MNSQVITVDLGKVEHQTVLSMCGYVVGGTYQDQQGTERISKQEILSIAHRNQRQLERLGLGKKAC